jgi:hypothetical protein
MERNSPKSKAAQAAVTNSRRLNEAIRKIIDSELKAGQRTEPLIPILREWVPIV